VLAKARSNIKGITSIHRGRMVLKMLPTLDAHVDYL
jgi:hypothetical protein